MFKQTVQFAILAFVLTAAGAGSALTQEIREAAEVYRVTPQGELKMHFHFPPGWSERDRRPAILFFFGGGWKGGTVNQFATQAKHLASRGMVAARAEYRIKDRHNTRPYDAVVDARAAIAWLHEQRDRLGIDGSRLVAAGGSAGGHLAALTAYGSPAGTPRPSALVLFNPVTDLRDMRDRIDTRDDKGVDRAEEISPITQLGRAALPTILFYGTADTFFEQGKAFAAASRGAGGTVELLTAADQPHAFFNRSPWLELTLIETDRFLAALGYLNGPSGLSPPDGAAALRPASDR